MEKERTLKGVVIVALLIAVLGLSLGFAAFSQTLRISSSATVTPSDNMYVYFASSNQKNGDGQIVADPVGATPAQYDFEGDVQVEHKAVIDNSNPKAPVITGLRADFTEPGQTVVYKFYAYNSWEYATYLKGINIDSTKTCVAKEGTLSDDSSIKEEQEFKINEACKSINVSVKVGNDEDVSTTVGNIDGHSLASGTFEDVIVTIKYDANGSVADTDFNVTFGDITLNYNSTN